MTPGPLRFWPAWWLVAFLHVATTAGTWIVTDQSEAIHTARHWLTTGTLTLREDGVRPAEMPWLRTVKDEPVRSRQLPLTMLTHVPLVALDRLFGLERPVEHGRFVHLQGHVLVLLALALLGAAIERSTGDARGAAFAVVATGVCWPVWMASRNGCAEPVEMLLVAGFLVFGPDLRPQTPATQAVRAGCAFALSWVNPAGTVLALALAATAALREPRRTALVMGFAAAGGALSVAIAWNWLFHGNALFGGYQKISIGGHFTLATLGASTAAQAKATAVQGLVLLGLALRASLRDPKAREAALGPALLYAAVFLLFAAFVMPEPERRFAPVWPAFGLVVGLHYGSLRLRSPWPQAVLAVGFLLGFRDFFHAAGRTYLGPDGLFWPGVLWVRMAFEGAAAAALGALGALGLAALVAAEKVALLLRSDGRAARSC
jgi:hypothetical protein